MVRLIGHLLVACVVQRAAEGVLGDDTATSVSHVSANATLDTDGASSSESLPFASADLTTSTETVREPTHARAARAVLPEYFRKIRQRRLSVAIASYSRLLRVQVAVGLSSARVFVFARLLSRSREDPEQEFS